MVECISLFSGAGGLDVGAENAGVKIVACVENDSDSVSTLKANSKNKKKQIIFDDIANVSFRDLKPAKSDFIIIGGPPCQPFSKNGYWVKNENRLIQQDPRNLLSQFLRAVQETKPNGFLFENVESMLHPTNKSEVERFLVTADKFGYKCTLYKANAADFGVPQRRKRIFIFGIRKSGTAVPNPKTLYMAAKSKDSEFDLPLHLGVGKFIEKFNTKEFFEKSEIADNGNYFYELKHVPAGSNYMALSKLKNYKGRTFKSGSRFWNFLQKLHPDEPSITIAAQPGPWVGPFHWDSRRLRVPEIAAIQTFPEDYVFVGNRRSVQKQIGNAVPCLLGQRMVEHLLEHLE